MDVIPQENMSVGTEQQVSGTPKKALHVIIGVVALLVVGGGAFALMQSGVLKGGSPMSFAKAYEAFNNAKTINFDKALSLELGLKPGILGAVATAPSAPTPATPPLTHVTFQLKGK